MPEVLDNSGADASSKLGASTPVDRVIRQFPTLPFRMEISRSRATRGAQPLGDEENEPISPMSSPVEFVTVQTQQSQNGRRDEYAARPRPAL
jgi:hypothetical protein